MYCTWFFFPFPFLKTLWTCTKRFANWVRLKYKVHASSFSLGGGTLWGSTGPSAGEAGEGQAAVVMLRSLPDLIVLTVSRATRHVCRFSLGKKSCRNNHFGEGDGFIHLPHFCCLSYLLWRDCRTNAFLSHRSPPSQPWRHWSWVSEGG